MFLTFFGAARGDKHTHEHAHESPKVMLVPLAVLALGAIFSGMVCYKPFFGDHRQGGSLLRHCRGKCRHGATMLRVGSSDCASACRQPVLKR